LVSDVDAALIATPVYLHPEHFEAAVKSGKHVYMEKPAGLDVAGCKRAMRIADAADRRAEHHFRVSAGGVYVKAKQMLDSVSIGKGYLETAREYWTYNSGAGPVTEKAEHDITVDALAEFVRRVSECKPENVGVRAAESTHRWLSISGARSPGTR
jgi:predicted dehydrogenase